MIGLMTSGQFISTFAIQNLNFYWSAQESRIFSFSHGLGLNANLSVLFFLMSKCRNFLSLDEDYQKFLEVLNAEIEPLPSAEAYLEELEAKQRAAASEYLNILSCLACFVAEKLRKEVLYDRVAISTEEKDLLGIESQK